MSTGANSRVIIPSNVRKTIGDIKEMAAGKHSDEDIYEMLKECNMDPNETAQKLLYLDTFHEVKRKRDRKKTKASGQSSADYRLMSAMPRRGAARNSHDQMYYISDVSSDSRRRHIKQPNGVNSSMLRSSNTSTPVAYKAENNSTSNVHAITDNAGHESRVTPVVSANKSEKISSLSPILVNHHLNLNPGPTPAPTPTFIPGTENKNKLVITSPASSSVSGVYSSASDPVLVPNLNARNPGTVGTIKRETGSHHTATEVIGTVNYKTTTEPKDSQGVSVTATQPVVAVENRQSKQVKGHSEAGPQLDMKSARQSVIFPNHLQVPESFRIGLTFGSLDPQSDPCISFSKESMPVEIVSVEPKRNQDACSAAQKGDYTGKLQPHQRGSENTSTFSVSGASPVYDQSKPEKCPPSVGGSQLSLLQTPTDHSLGFVPPILGPHLVCIEAPEQQSVNSQVSSTSGSNSSVVQPPVGLGQSSVTMPPHMFPLVRQPYPPNYIPYSPYIPHLYMPQSAHQFLGSTSGFPQQPSSGNFYMSPPVTAAAAGVKLPLPSLYKPAAISGNLNHFGFPAGHSSYGSSTVSYSASPVQAPIRSASNEDLTASQLKEKNVYPMQKQNEDSHSRMSAPGRDLSMPQTNYFYNIPQDQNVAFPGINPSQTIAAPSNIQPLAQQPQIVQANIHWNDKLLNRENI